MKLVRTAVRKSIPVILRTLTVIKPKWNTELAYRLNFRKKWDRKNPVTLNDKVLWLKYNTYYKNPLIIRCADKYRVRKYLEKNGFDELLPKLYKVYCSPQEICYDDLLDKFAVKLNVGCKCNFICDSKSKVDETFLKNLASEWFENGRKYYLDFAEMQYKNVKPCYIC